MFVICYNHSSLIQSRESLLLTLTGRKQQAMQNRFAATGFCSECGNNVYRLVLSSSSLFSLLDVQHLEGVRNYQTLDLEVAVNLPILHALNCGGYSAENLCFVCAGSRFLTLDVCHDEAQLPDDVILKPG